MSPASTEFASRFFTTEPPGKPPSTHMGASPNISISYQVVNLFTIDGSTLIYHHYPKSRVYIKVDFWCYTFYGFGQVDNDLYPSLPDTVYFQCFKSLLYSTYLSTPFPMPGIHLFFFSVSMVLTDLGNIKVGVIQNVIFSDWHLSCNNKHLSFLHVFVQLKSSFLFSAE